MKIKQFAKYTTNGLGIIADLIAGINGVEGTTYIFSNDEVKPNMEIKY